jgi:hypothetical protein
MAAAMDAAVVDDHATAGTTTLPLDQSAQPAYGLATTEPEK